MCNGRFTVIGHGVPGMWTVLHCFLAVLAPLEAVVHDVHIGARFDGVSGLSGSLGVLLLPWPVDVPVDFSHILSHYIRFQSVMNGVEILVGVRV
jgi:hypothetical protein